LEVEVVVCHVALCHVVVCHVVVVDDGVQHRSRELQGVALPTSTCTGTGAGVCE
jgi:hypothetical protein